MFGHDYFGAGYYDPGYWAPPAGTVVPVAPTISPDILTDRHGRPIAAQSLYVRLVRYYGTYEGERIYYNMAREHKGPFADDKKYAGHRPYEPSTPAVPQRAAVTGLAKPPPRRN